MRKLKTIALLLLAVLLIAAGAFLPRITAALQDGDTLGEAHFEQVKPVQLTIQEDTPALAKLALMNRLSGTIAIPDSKASMTPEEVEEAAYTAMQPYIDAGLMLPLDAHSTEIRCLLGQSVEQPDLNGIFWSVLMVSDSEEDYYAADIAIDDETGNLLLINYTREVPFLFQNREPLLSVFGEIYFNSLDISDHGYFVAEEPNESYGEENAVCVWYRFGDVQYGEVNVALHIYENGFYTEFPKQ